MRKRMVDPCIWTDDGFLQSSLPARLLFIGLITTADDDGKGQGSAASLKAAVFPSDDISIDAINTLKIELAKKMRVEFYECEGRQYYRLCKWHNHQYVQSPKPSKIPDPQELTECSDAANVAVSPNTIQNKTKQNNNTSYPVSFEEWWKIYPRKIEKAGAFLKWKATLRKGATEDNLMIAVLAYAAACAADGREARFIKHPSTFLGPSESWRDFLSPGQERTAEQVLFGKD